MMKRRNAGGKVNAKGRSTRVAKHVGSIGGSWTAQTYRHLSCYGRALLVELVYRHNGENNGQVPMSVREAATRLDISPTTAVKIFRELKDKGFIRQARRGSIRPQRTSRHGVDPNHGARRRRQADKGFHVLGATGETKHGTTR